MSDFAKQQLKKYGWSEGKGLGKEENGIVKPIKPKLKFDNHGVRHTVPPDIKTKIGHDESKLWTSKWWSNVFNDASKRISVIKNERGVQVNCEEKAIESTLPEHTTYKNFVKSGTLVDVDEICNTVQEPKESYVSTKRKRSKTKTTNIKEKNSCSIKKMKTTNKQKKNRNNERKQ